MQKVIALLGALDTKGEEFAYLKSCIEKKGMRTLVIDIGVLEAPKLQPDITRQEVAQAGGSNMTALLSKKDRGESMDVMSKGVASLLPRLFAGRRFDAIISLGGGGGTSVACTGMRKLPLGVPKIMVSTLAGGDVTHFVGHSDIVMMPSIVDIAGLNRISREVIARAGAAICAMADTQVVTEEDRPLIAASMFGNTTQAVEYAKALLEKEGYEVLVFHATGTGGQIMESLVASGKVAGVLDITTTEWADEAVGGVLSAGPERLDAAAKKAIPAVVAPGCLDMVNFWAPETIPEKFKGRKFYQHNPNVTLMRTDVEENAALGEIIAQKLNLSAGPISVVIPRKGFSVIGAPGGPFYWPEADNAFIEHLIKNLRPDISVNVIDCHINEPAFADACVEALLNNIRVRKSRATAFFFAPKGT